MGNYNLKNVQFCRQSLLEKMSRPLPVMALYPKNATDTKLFVQIINNATVIAIRYVSTSVTNESITFTGKSVEDVVQEINQLNIPIEAATIHNTLVLQQGEFVPLGADFVELPGAFTAYDRIDNNGILLRAKKLAVRHKNASKIRTLNPYFESPSLPWYPRVSNGSFSQKYNGKLYHFYIPEYHNQSWSTKYGKPFKDLYGVEPVLKEENVYQLPRFPVYWDGQNITLYNGDVPISEKAIEDVDVNNGLLYTKPGVYLQDGFSVDYSYLESSYVYKEININGHFSQNPLILDKYVVIYILPAESNQGVRKRTIFHAIGDSVDQAIDSIELTDPTIPIAIIGAYNIQQLFSSDKISILDTRGKGGGLKLPDGPRSPVHDIDPAIESDEVPIEELYDEAYRYWDIGHYDGDPYPGAAAVAVDLPIDLQEVLSISDIKKKTSKFMAAGVYPSIKYTERDLPSVSGMSAQVSCAYNLDFTSERTGEATGDLSQTYGSALTGEGWFKESYNHPESILSGDWASFDPELEISAPLPRTIEVNTSTGVVMPFLKSTPWAGVSWEEREIVYNEGSTKDPVTFTDWKKVKYYDVKTAETGQLVKAYLSLDPNNVTKQYRRVRIHSPYLTGNLEELLKTNISTIIDNTVALQGDPNSVTIHGTTIVSGYASVTDKTNLAVANDYTLLNDRYKHFFKMEDTPLEDEYYQELFEIGEDFISAGTYNSGHYFKNYLQNVNEYVVVPPSSPYGIFSYNDQLKALNGYLNMRARRGTWSGFCNSGAESSTGLVNELMTSTTYSGPFEKGVPIYWTYFPPLSGSPDFISGFLFQDPIDAGGSIADVASDINVDFTYNFSLPAIMSSTVANTGETIFDAGLQAAWTGAYGLTVEQTVNNIEDAILSNRTYSGFATPTHWFIGHNRLGTYLGNTLFNMTEAYDYVNKYNRQRDVIDDVAYPPGASANFMNYMFSGIEKVLEAGYDAVYQNLLRGGIVEADMALTLYGYGWYLNNWSKNYGVRGKTYDTDKREKYEHLFQNGLRQLVKNQVTPDGELLETTTVYGEVGPFSAATASKVLYPLGEALRYDYSNWAGIAEGVVTTLVNKYSEDGLYYQNPYRQSAAAGKETDVLGGMINMYKGIAQTGTFDYWEPMSTGLTTLRGTEFLPPFDSYGSPPTGDWEGVQNPLAFWKYYHTGDAHNALSVLKGAGINAIEVPLDYLYWKENSGEFHSKFADLLSGCYANRIRAIPVLMEGGTTAVVSGQESDYVNSFGHTGGRYYYEPIKHLTFMGGDPSGQPYVDEMVNTYDKDPAILAWSVVSTPVNNAQALVNYNTMAYHIKQLTDTPVIYNSCSNLTVAEYLGINKVASTADVGDQYRDAETVNTSDIYNTVSPLYNPNFDFLGIQPNSVFCYFLDNIMESIAETVTKPIMVTKYGDGGYADYSRSIERVTSRGIPFTLSSFMVTSGQYWGNLYSDGRSRSTKQLLALHQAAVDDGVQPTGAIDQVTIFGDRYQYPTGFTPAYNSYSILQDLSSWNTRDSFSSDNSGEIYRQIDVLSVAQTGLDTLNYVYKWPENQYYVPKSLTVQECDALNYYSTTWDTIDLFQTGAAHWTLSGSIDYDRYNDFIGEWGNYLFSLFTRLNIDG